MTTNVIDVRLEVDDKGSVTVKQFSDGAKRHFTEVENHAKKTAAGMSAAWKEAGRAFLAYMSVQQVVAFGKSIIDLGDALYTTSQKTGVTVETLDKLRQIGEQNNVTFDEIGNSLKFLSKNLVDASTGSGEASDMFEALGLNVNELLKLNPEERFMAVAKAIGNLADEGEQAKAAMVLMGRGGDALKLVFRDLEREMKKVKAVMTTEESKAWDEFNDNMSKMKNTLIGVANVIMKQWVPAVTKMWDVLYGKVGNPKKLLIDEMEGELAKKKKALSELENAKYFNSNWSTDVINLKQQITLLQDKLSILKETVAKEEENKKTTEETTKATGKLNIKNKEGADEAKKALEEKIKLTEIWAEMYFEINNTAYDSELRKLNLILDKLREKNVITAEQADEFRGAWNKKQFSVDTRFGGGRDESEMENDRAIEKYRENLKVEEEYEAQIKKINASVTGDKKAMMEADLAEIAAWKAQQDKDLPELADLWNRVADAKTKAVQIQYQSDWEKWANSAKSAMEQVEAVSIHAAETFASGFTDAIFEFVDGTKSAKDAFLDFARSFLTEIAKMIMQQMILNALKSVAGSYFGFADGGIISGGTGQMMPIQAFASGGVVKRPTMAIMGEGKYNEAVVPLPDGRSIPVSMKGGGNQFNINVNVDGSKGGTPEQNDKLGKQIAREVKEQVKKIIADERRYGGTLGAQAARAY